MLLQAQICPHFVVTSLLQLIPNLNGYISALLSAILNTSKIYSKDPLQRMENVISDSYPNFFVIYIELRGKIKSKILFLTGSKFKNTPPQESCELHIPSSVLALDSFLYHTNSINGLTEIQQGRAKSKFCPVTRFACFATQDIHDFPCRSFTGTDKPNKAGASVQQKKLHL